MTYETFDDARQQPFAFVTGESATVPLPRDGTVTSLTCRPGATIASGDVPLTIDATPVATLHTGYPLWRDLVSGDTGPDVAAVQAELRRLGYRAGTSQTMDRATRRALTAFFTDRGYVRPDGSLPRGAVIWLPSTEVVVAGCSVAVADAVTAGEALMTTGGRARRARQPGPDVARLVGGTPGGRRRRARGPGRRGAHRGGHEREAAVPVLQGPVRRRPRPGVPHAGGARDCRRRP